MPLTAAISRFVRASLIWTIGRPLLNALYNFQRSAAPCAWVPILMMLLIYVIPNGTNVRRNLWPALSWIAAKSSVNRRRRWPKVKTLIPLTNRPR